MFDGLEPLRSLPQERRNQLAIFRIELGFFRQGQRWEAIAPIEINLATEEATTFVGRITVIEKIADCCRSAAELGKGRETKLGRAGAGQDHDQPGCEDSDRQESHHPELGAQGSEHRAEE